MNEKAFRLQMRDVLEKLHCADALIRAAMTDIREVAPLRDQAGYLLEKLGKGALSHQQLRKEIEVILVKLEREGKEAA